MIRENSAELSEISTLFHLGACSSTTETDEEYLNDNNLGYTRELCQWSLQNNVRFVYASSASTYGDGSLGMNDQDEDWLNLSHSIYMVGRSINLIFLHRKWLARPNRRS